MDKKIRLPIPIFNNTKIVAMNTGSVQLLPNVTGRLSDLRIILLYAPSPPICEEWHIALFVPEYSNDWLATDSHRLSFLGIASHTYNLFEVQI